MFKQVLFDNFELMLQQQLCFSRTYLKNKQFILITHKTDAVVIVIAFYIIACFFFNMVSVWSSFFDLNWQYFKFQSHIRMTYWHLLFQLEFVWRMLKGPDLKSLGLHLLVFSQLCIKKVFLVSSKNMAICLYI